MRLRLASYNIHGCIGGDGRFDIERVLAVLNSLDGDIIALQEVGTRRESSGTRLFEELIAGTGCTGIHGPTLFRGNAPYGNALLIRLPLLDLARIDLTVARHEPRAALSAELDWAGLPLRVLSTHLGLWPGERRQQVRRLLANLPRDRQRLYALMGDINEWLMWGRPLRWLHAHFGRPPAPATFPAARPALALDRIWVHPVRALRRVWVHDTPLARAASDHLPILAELERPDGGM
jgi:endonuclease/exonuclease/phosphatase family metal-dependent hydrolase